MISRHLKQQTQIKLSGGTDTSCFIVKYFKTRPFACQLVTNLLPSLSPTGAHDCDCSRRRKLTHQHLLVFAEEVCFDFIHFSRSSHLYLSCQSFAVIWYTEISQFRLWKSVNKSFINSFCQNFGSKI